jgi:hypothetical protein
MRDERRQAVQELEQERRGREETERELEELRRQLQALREARESPQTLEEEPERSWSQLCYGRVSGGRAEALVEEGVLSDAISYAPGLAADI